MMQRSETAFPPITSLRSPSHADASVSSETNDGELALGHGRLTWLAEAARGPAQDGFRYVLVLRFALVNLVAASALLGAAYMQGFIDRVLVADPTHLCLAISCVFLFGFGVSAVQVLHISRELNRVRDFHPLLSSRAASYFALIRGNGGERRRLAADTLKLKLSQRISVVRQIAQSLVLLGLIGTVIGFIVALSGVDPTTASDVEAIAPMVSGLIEGMGIALYTTLVGSVLSLWLGVNYQILAGGTVKLISAIVEYGERHVRD